LIEQIRKQVKPMEPAVPEPVEPGRIAGQSRRLVSLEG
jgi:hypothetical protein